VSRDSLLNLFRALLFVMQALPQTELEVEEKLLSV